MTAHDHDETALYSECRVQELKPLFNNIITVLASGVILIGVLSILGYLFANPVLYTFSHSLPHQIKFSLIGPLGVIFAGIGLKTILDSHPYELMPKWLWPFRYLGFLVPGTIGLWWTIQYLTHPDYQLLTLLTHHSEVLLVSFFTAVNLLITGIGLGVFFKWQRNEQIMVFFMGPLALFQVFFNVFALVGHVLDIPALYHFRGSLPPYLAFLICGLTFLVATLPFRGVLLPFFTYSRKSRILCMASLIAGVGILLQGIVSVTTFHGLSESYGIPKLDLIHLEFMVLFIWGSAILASLVVTLALRAIHYFNESAYYARRQEKAKLREVMFRNLIQTIHGTLDLEPIFQTIVNVLGVSLNVDRCLIAQCNPDNQSFNSPITEYRASQALLTMQGYENKLTPAIYQDLCQGIQDTDMPPLRFIEPASSSISEETRLFIQTFGVKTAIARPIIYRDRCLAMVLIQQVGKDREWTSDDLDLIDLIAQEAAVAIYQSILYHSEQQARQALQVSEAKFRQVVENNVLGFAFSNREGDIMDANEAFLTMTGYTEEAMHAGELNWRKLTPSEYVYQDADAFQEAALNGRFAPYEKQLIAKDGHLVDVLVGGAQLIGTKEQLVVFVTDISELKLMERELAQAKEKAETASQRKSQALANMSHELRTPLNAIISYADMILKGMTGPINSKLKRYVFNISTSGRHLMDLITDILDISKIEAGRFYIKPQQIQLAVFVRELRSIVQPFAEEKRVKLIIDLEPGINGMVADPARMKQIMLNLLSNAIKFNREGGEVVLSMTKSPDRSWVTIHVKDTGIGIPQDKLPHLFTEFYQVIGTTKEHTGTGLGLALTKRLVELHGGTIDITSHEGIGTKVTVKLPTTAVTAMAPVA